MPRDWQRPLRSLRSLPPFAALRDRRSRSNRDETTALAARLGELVVEDVRVHLPEVGAPVYLVPGSHTLARIVRHGEYEPHAIGLLRQAMAERPDHDVIDVGANVGIMTTALALRLAPGRRLLAVEPGVAAFGRLRRNIDALGMGDRVIAVRAACGTDDGELELKVLDQREEYSTLGELIHPAAEGEYRTERVTVRTLDDLVAEYGLRPGVIKVDVEGWEPFVLRGAARTLAEHHPTLLLEFAPTLIVAAGACPDALLADLRSRGYELSDPGAPYGEVGARPFGEVLAVRRSPE